MANGKEYMVLENLAIALGGVVSLGALGLMGVMVWAGYRWREEQRALDQIDWDKADDAWSPWGKIDDQNR